MVNMKLTMDQSTDLAWLLRAMRGDFSVELVRSFVTKEEIDELLADLRTAILYEDYEEKK